MRLLVFTMVDMSTLRKRNLALCKQELRILRKEDIQLKTFQRGFTSLACFPRNYHLISFHF